MRNPQSLTRWVVTVQRELEAAHRELHLEAVRIILAPLHEREAAKIRAAVDAFMQRQQQREEEKKS